jgi:hypothetical protein
MASLRLVLLSFFAIFTATAAQVCSMERPVSVLTIQYIADVHTVFPSKKELLRF